MMKKCAFCPTETHVYGNGPEAQKIMRDAGWRKIRGKDACNVCYGKKAGTYPPKPPRYVQLDLKKNLPPWGKY